MILILVYWFILFLFASLSGIAFQNSFGLSKKNSAITLLYGIIFQTFFLSIIAFFYRIHNEILVANFLLQIIIFFKYKTEFLRFIKNLFESFSKKQFYLFIGLTLSIALKSAQLPTIFDNESYYIQTIKWINEYGFVKGLANVHPFLGQFSFWHVLQSGFNFPFLTNPFNDINGFVLLIGIYYFIEKYNKTGFNWSFFGIVFIVFYYQFIEAPSSDLPILVFSAVIFYEFIEKTIDFKTLLLFSLYIFIIKVTFFPIVLLSLFSIKKDKRDLFFLLGCSTIFGLFFVAKNIIISGYPLFPLPYFPINFDWKMSSEVLSQLSQIVTDGGYSEHLVPTKDLSYLEKFVLWIKLDGLNAIFNRGMLFLFIIIPFTTFFKTTIAFKKLYAILLIHFVILLLISPQYRYFLPTFILFATVLLYEISTYFKFSIKNSVVLFSLFLVTISLFIDIKKPTNGSTFALSQLVIPEANTKYENNKFISKSIGNFYYFDPKLPNLYETSNGNLPCVNEKLFHYYHYFPQQRTNDIKDGFYPKEINHE